MPKKPRGLSQLPHHLQQAHERAVQNGEAIAARWKAKGYTVKVSIDPLFSEVKGKPTSAVIGFKTSTDMVNGLPREYAPPKPESIRVRRYDADERGGLFHY